MRQALSSTCCALLTASVIGDSLYWGYVTRILVRNKNGKTDKIDLPLQIENYLRLLLSYDQTYSKFKNLL